MDILLLVLIGVAAGVMSGLFGIGGGVVIVPALMLLAKMPPQLATGTSLGVFLLPVGILGALTYYRNGNLEVRSSLLVAAGLFVGAYFGAAIAQNMAPLMLRRLFAVFLAAVALRLWFTR
jgi:uncharacterized membrane protein YfcA